MTLVTGIDGHRSRSHDLRRHAAGSPHRRGPVGCVCSPTCHASGAISGEPPPSSALHRGRRPCPCLRASASARQLGNQVGVMPVSLPAEGGLAQRLERTAEITRGRKSQAPGASAELLAGANRLLATLHVMGWLLNHQRLIHTAVTNLRGPEQRPGSRPARPQGRSAGRAGDQATRPVNTPQGGHGTGVHVPKDQCSTIFRHCIRAPRNGAIDVWRFATPAGGYDEHC